MIDLIDAGLEGAEHVYVTVGTSRGPHVTPELFTVSGGRIVCLTSVTTLKARIARRTPAVGFAAQVGSSAMVGVGTAEVLDPAAPSTVLKAPSLAVGAPAGIARFARDNAAELMGAALDLLTGRLGSPIPPHRVVLAITPTAVALVDDDELGPHRGWELEPAASEPLDDDDGDHDPTAVDLSGVPPDLVELASSDRGILGWQRADGSPLALPARWALDGRLATMPTAVFELVGAAPASAAAITFDTWTRLGPTGKQGVMLRGTGSAAADGGSTTVALDIDRVTHWDGVDTGTVKADPGPDSSNGAGET